MEAGWGQKWGQSQPSRRVSRSEGTEQRHESEGPKVEGKGAGSGAADLSTHMRHGIARPAANQLALAVFCA